MDTNRLKSYIILNGLTVKTLAFKMNISKSALYRKLNGKSDFTRTEVCMLMTILKIPVDEALVIFFEQKVS